MLKLSLLNEHKEMLMLVYDFSKRRFFYSVPKASEVPCYRIIDIKRWKSENMRLEAL